MPAEALIYGRLVPDDDMTPWCDNTLSKSCGLMYWLQTAGESVDADAKIKRWLPAAPAVPNRIVYYLNGSGYLPSDSSPIDTIILGFVYPYTTDTGVNTNNIPKPKIYDEMGIPDWAAFGLYYAYIYWGDPNPHNGFCLNPTDAAALNTWREKDPRRKVMIGIGGAASVPLYATWAQPGGSDYAARGLKIFMDNVYFSVDGKKFPFHFDGVDVDYEDSRALTPFPGASYAATKSNMLANVQPSLTALLPTIPMTSPLLIVALVLLCLIIILLAVGIGLVVVAASKKP
jgi:hypothetical protein